MNINHLILLFSFLLLGSEVVSSQSKAGNLPIIDISKQYPKKEVCLQDVADSEYVPLETTDDVLLSGIATLSAVTNKYILIHEPRRGDIYVFDRKGKLYSRFNHLGQSGQEYSWIKTGTILDEKNEEIYVCSQSVQVYSLSGEYKRTLNINTFEYDMKIFNFDDKSLLVYEDVIIDPRLKNKTKKKPYRLVSKKDGSLISVLDIHLPKRYSTHVSKTVNNVEQGTFIYYDSNMCYSQDFMIADISSDTLYHLSSDKKLTPLLTRKPSVHATEPPVVWYPLLTTDKFVIIGSLPLEFNQGGRIPNWMYEFDTGKISKVSFKDNEFDRRDGGYGYSFISAKNSNARLIQASTMINASKSKRLRGNGQKIAEVIMEDDNPVVRILKFK